MRCDGENIRLLYWIKAACLTDIEKGHLEDAGASVLQLMLATPEAIAEVAGILTPL